MIPESSIQNLSLKYQSTELNIRREYIQHLFLSYFYRQPESDKIYFKGGTALRIIFKSPRFSEDLDFSATATTINKLEDIIIQTTREIEREGINVDIAESTNTSGGYLAIVNFMLNDQKISIQLEVSQRKRINKGDVATIANDFIPPYTIIVLSQEQLITEKIQALLDRKKARDFYDLYYILRANLLSTKEKDILKKVLIVLKTANIRFESELKLFLPRSHWAIIRDFKKTLEQEINRTI